jgi:hypothetical protein
MVEEVKLCVIYLIHCKNLCKCHSVAPPITTRKEMKRSLIHFEKYYRVRDCLVVSGFCVDNQFSKHHLLKRIFSSICVFGSVVKHHMTVAMRVSFGSVLLVCMSGFVPGSFCFCCYGSVV